MRDGSRRGSEGEEEARREEEDARREEEEEERRAGEEENRSMESFATAASSLSYNVCKICHCGGEVRRGKGGWGGRKER